MCVWIYVVYTVYIYSIYSVYMYTCRGEVRTLRFERQLLRKMCQRLRKNCFWLTHSRQVTSGYRALNREQRDATQSSDASHGERTEVQHNASFNAFKVE